MTFQQKPGTEGILTYHDRPPVGWLTYPRNHEHIVGRVVGPSHLGESWKAVEAAYDPATDRTRVGLVIASRDDILKDLAARS